MKTYLIQLTLALGLTAGSPAFATKAFDRNPVRITVCRQLEQLVKLTPNPTFSGSLSVISETKEPVHFYVFDVEGTLIFHTLLLPGNKRIISELKEGEYSYDVFRKDESVEQGKISVRERKKEPLQASRKKIS